MGSGQVATVLARKILAAGYEIIQVFSRQPSHARILAAELGCTFVSNGSKVDDRGDLYLAAVSDQGLYQLRDSISLINKLVVHTAGAVSMNVLSSMSKNYGVMYPLQSLRKEIRAPAKIPLLVDANTPDNLTLVWDFAKSISPIVLQADDDSRLKLHLTSVFVNNFANHLYFLAQNFCQAENVDFSLLLPLIEETANRLNISSPDLVQTGPAMRRDQDTLQRHLALLSSHPELKQIYQMLTDSIQRFN
jgi:predicted short-subunit dehydrogenase-like oxidoreductase (DUF2520 family)